MNKFLKIKNLTAFVLALMLMLFSVSCSGNDSEKSAQTEYTPETVVASIGDQTVTYALYKAAFDSYADYLQQIGYDPFSDESELKGFQEMVIDALLADMVTLHHAKEDGFTISDESVETAKSQAREELEEIRANYWALAQTEYEKDPSQTVEQHFERMIGELSEFYTGRKMTFEEYSEDYTNEIVNSKLLEEYKEHICSEFPVSEENILEWYETQLDVDKALFEKQPGQYKADMEYFERFGGRYSDAYPITYVPEGFSRIMDIVVHPSGALGEEYSSKLAQLDSIASECSTLLFNNALNGSSENDERIQELLESYRTLKAEIDGMYDSYTREARETLERAYAELEAGADFSEVMAKYTDDTTVIGDETEPPCEAFLSKGKLIAIGIECPNDWSQTVKEIYSMTEKGSYSAIFSDSDGSLHIIYHGEDEPSGTVSIEELHDAISYIVRSESSDAQWSELLEAWIDDPEVKVDMDCVHSLGLDRLKKKEN